jgi:hypothetical protein
MKKKKKKKRRAKDPCDVPNCSRSYEAGWRPLASKYYRVCLHHLRRHNDQEDSFSLFTVLGILDRKPNRLNRFGHPIPKDYDECIAEVKQRNVVEKQAKRNKSLNRLKQWKANGGKSTKPKPRPVPQKELDSVVEDLLGEFL